jgi:hypothetical protein
MMAVQQLLLGILFINFSEALQKCNFCGSKRDKRYDSTGLLTDK